jgi:hypothetical protein
MVTKGNKKLLKLAKTGDFELKGHCSTNPTGPGKID